MPPVPTKVAALVMALAVLGGAREASAGAVDRPIWVVFRDKGGEAGTSASRAEARARLSPRSLARRTRMDPESPVGFADEAIPAAYLDSVRGTGARIRHVSRWLGAVSVDASPEQEARIRALPAVAAVQAVARRLPSPEEPPWDVALPPARRQGAGGWPPDIEEYGEAWEQLALVGVPDLHACGLDGAGVVVGIQDTGFDRSHPALAGAQVLAERDFLTGDDVTADEGADEVARGQDTHGTQVMSLVAADAPGRMLGVAPRATFLLSKTEDVSREVPIEEDHWVAGLEWQEAMGADLVTSSLGYLDWYSPADLDGETAVTTVAAEIAASRGLIVLNAAGNLGPGEGTLIAPADAEAALTVGAVDLSGSTAGFSSRGPTADGRVKPDVAAPGQDVLVARPGTADEYQRGSGTSFATPLTAGVVALLLQAWPEWGPEEVAAALTSTASRAGTPDNEQGHGLVDGLSAAGLYCSCHDLDDDGHFDAGCGGDDCDDSHPGIHPGAVEACDGRDGDCDGELDPEEGDGDGDGWDACADGDCDDADPAVHPGAAEVPYDGLDQDCDGGDLVDADGDGHAGEEAGGRDCDDADPARSPAASEECGNGVDDDCDGATDAVDAVDCPTAPGEAPSGPDGCGGCGGGGAATGLLLLVCGRRRGGPAAGE
ncbi:S8 family serine peptidase [Myxococcota bacterium]|nr:S8 family serine peptidase [Myxococcota bacterium]